MRNQLNATRKISLFDALSEKLFDQPVSDLVIHSPVKLSSAKGEICDDIIKKKSTKAKTEMISSSRSLDKQAPPKPQVIFSPKSRKGKRSKFGQFYRRYSLEARDDDNDNANRPNHEDRKAINESAVSTRSIPTEISISSHNMIDGECDENPIGEEENIVRAEEYGVEVESIENNGNTSQNWATIIEQIDTFDDTDTEMMISFTNTFTTGGSFDEQEFEDYIREEVDRIAARRDNRNSNSNTTWEGGIFELQLDHICFTPMPLTDDFSLDGLEANKLAEIVFCNEAGRLEEDDDQDDDQDVDVDVDFNGSRSRSRSGDGHAGDEADNETRDGMDDVDDTPRVSTAPPNVCPTRQPIAQVPKGISKNSVLIEAVGRIKEGKKKGLVLRLLRTMAKLRKKKKIENKTNRFSKVDKHSSKNDSNEPREEVKSVKSGNWDHASELRSLLETASSLALELIDELRDNQRMNSKFSS